MSSGENQESMINHALLSQCAKINYEAGLNAHKSEVDELLKKIELKINMAKCSYKTHIVPNLDDALFLIESYRNGG